jgi:hypothetical protein
LFFFICWKNEKVSNTDKTFAVFGVRHAELSLANQVKSSRTHDFFFQSSSTHLLGGRRDVKACTQVHRTSLNFDEDTDPKTTTVSRSTVLLVKNLVIQHESQQTRAHLDVQPGTRSIPVWHPMAPLNY